MTNNPRLSDQVRLAIEAVLVGGWCLTYEPGNGPERKHPRYVVIDAAGDLVASARTQDQAVFKSWMKYAFTDSP